MPARDRQTAVSYALHVTLSDTPNRALVHLQASEEEACVAEPHEQSYEVYLCTWKAFLIAGQ